MKRADWNRIVLAVEDATKKHMLAVRAHERAVFMLAEANGREARTDALTRVAERELQDAISAYGDASAQRARDGGTDEDRAEAAVAGKGAA